MTPSVPILLSVFFCTAAWTAFFLSARASRRTKTIGDRLRRDAAFAAWSRSTYITVFDSEGEAFHRSLYELQDADVGQGIVFHHPSSILIHGGDDFPAAIGQEGDSGARGSAG